MNRKWVIILVLLVLLGAGAYLAVQTLEANLERLAQLGVADVDLSAIADGTYSGAHTIIPISVAVEITVEDHRMTRIDLSRHMHGRGAAAEAVIERVLAEQSLEVDAVSGATYSSMVILKAIEEALAVAAQ